jgi:hypothetical protein
MRQGPSSPVSPLKQQPTEVLLARFVKLNLQKSISRQAVGAW